ARTIKAFLYDQIPAYPNLENIVLVGGDEMLPHRRVVDSTLVANQRRYVDYLAGDNVPLDPAIAAAYNHRYFLIDDYYASPLPLSTFGRELYLPQYSIGRLVETPAEIMGLIDVYLAGNQT